MQYNKYPASAIALTLRKDVGKRISKAVNNDFVKNFFTLGDACHVSFIRTCFAAKAYCWTYGTWFDLVFI